MTVQKAKTCSVFAFTLEVKGFYLSFFAEAGIRVIERVKVLAAITLFAANQITPRLRSSLCALTSSTFIRGKNFGDTISRLNTYDELFFDITLTSLSVFRQFTLIFENKQN